MVSLDTSALKLALSNAVTVKQTPFVAIESPNLTSDKSNDAVSMVMRAPSPEVFIALNAQRLL